MSAETRPKSAIELLERVYYNLHWLNDFADILETEGVKRFAREEKERLGAALVLLHSDLDDGK